MHGHMLSPGRTHRHGRKMPSRTGRRRQGGSCSPEGPVPVDHRLGARLDGRAHAVPHAAARVLPAGGAHGLFNQSIDKATNKVLKYGVSVWMLRAVSGRGAAAPLQRASAGPAGVAHLKSSTTRLPRTLCTVPNHQPYGWQRRPFHCTSTSSPTVSPAADAAPLQAEARRDFVKTAAAGFSKAGRGNTHSGSRPVYPGCMHPTRLLHRARGAWSKRVRAGLQHSQAASCSHSAHPSPPYTACGLLLRGGRRSRVAATPASSTAFIPPIGR